MMMGSGGTPAKKTNRGGFHKTARLALQLFTGSLLITPQRQTAPLFSMGCLTCTWGQQHGKEKRCKHQL